jgi:zinc protease
MKPFQVPEARSSHTCLQLSAAQGASEVVSRLAGFRTGRVSPSSGSQVCRWVSVFLWMAVGLVTLIAGPSQKTPGLTQRPAGTAKSIRLVGPYLTREDLDEYTKVVLKNGLTVILFERRDLPLVSIATYIKAGEFSEIEGQGGISRLAERMFFKGTGRREARQIAQELRRLGGYLSAESSYDYTLFSMTLPAENFRPGLDIQADALQNPSWPETALQRQAALMLQDDRSEPDNPSAFSLKKLHELSFGNSLLRHGDVSRKQVLDFYKRWYIPSNIVLVIAGSLDRRSVLEEVVKHYANMPAADRVELKPPVPPAQTKLRYGELRGDLRESFVQIGFAAPVAFSPAWYACKVLEGALTAGRAAILNRKLKEALGLASSVSSSYLDLKNWGYLAFALTADPNKIDRAEAAVFAELERIRSGLLGEQDIERARSALERDFYLNQEKLDELALQLARFETLAGHAEWRDYVKKIRAVGSQQAIQVARNYFSLPQSSVIEYQPGTAPPRSMTSDTLADSITRRLPLAMEEAKTEGLEGVLKEPNKQAVTRPSRRPERQPAEIGPASLEYPLTQYSILRGPDVLVKESHALPLISLGLFFPGGRVFENKQNSGITELMLRTSIKGTAHLSTLRISSIFENYGLKMDLKIEPDFFGYLLTGLSQNIGDAFETLLDVIKNPQFAEEQIEKEKHLLETDAARFHNNRMLVAQQLFLQALYDDHSYALPFPGSRESISKVTQDDLVRWHRRFVKGAVPRLAIAGDTQGSAFAARFANELSTSESSAVDLKKALPVKRLESPSTKLETRPSDQTALVLGFLGPPSEDSSNDSLEVIQNLVSGSGGRFDELCEKQGLAYRVAPSETRRVLNGSFSCYLTTSPQNEQRALDSLKDEFKRLRVAPITGEELVQARNRSAGMYRIRLQQRQEQVVEFAQSSIFGKSVEEIKMHPQHLLEVDQELVQETAGKYFDEDRFALGILRAFVK